MPHLLARRHPSLLFPSFLLPLKFQFIPTLLEIFYFCSQHIIKYFVHKYPKFTLLCPGHVKICETLLLSHTLMWSEYGVHMSLLSYFINLEFSSEILSLMVMSMCTFIVCCRISAFCCALILCIIPGCQRRGQVP